MESTKTIGHGLDAAPQATGRLRFCLLGGFEILENGLPLPRTRSRTEQWLLAWLLLRAPQPVERSWLAGTLWPDSAEAQAFGNLRRSLNNLRQVLGPDAYRLISLTPRTLAFDLSGASCDLTEFDALIAQGTRAALERALALYRGPLLPACDEAWLLPEREAREQAWLAALETLALQALHAGQPLEAVALLHQAIAADPYRETAQRALMEALAAAGDRAGATLAYRRFRLRLHDDLQTEPSPETQQLYRRLRLGAQEAGAETRARPLVSSAPPVPAPRLHVPWPVSDLIGREAEREEVAALLAASRLVTLTGTGGVGKTRLALAVADCVAEDFPDGVWFVDLAPLSDPAFVPQTLAKILSVQEEPGRPLRETLIDHLRPKQLLLLLDNCEHLVAECAHLAYTLLQGCPSLRLLATSRQPLGLTGERAWRVPSLPLPEPTRSEDLTLTLLDYAGSRLFLERAVEASASFTLTQRNAPAILQICRRLDGIPLALELAAARVSVLSVEQIAARLDDAFGLLTGGSRAALPRHQTLRALIDWSYNLLTDLEKSLLGRLSIFAGSWMLEAAEAVCAEAGKREKGKGKRDTDPSFPWIEDREVLDLLAELVSRSLVQVETKGDAARYRLLETIRHYGQERLREAGEEALLRARHRTYFLGLAREAEGHLTGPDQAVWLQRLEAEYANLRAALEGAGGSEEKLDLAGALGRFWRMHGYLSEGRRWQKEALGENAAGPVGLRGKVWNEMGVLALYQGDYPAAQTAFEAALRMKREKGDRQGIAAILTNLGLTAMYRQEFALSQAMHEESLALQRELGDRAGIAGSLNNLGALCATAGDYAAALVYHEESLAIKRDLKDTSGIASSLTNIGVALLMLGNPAAYPKAHACLTESLRLSQDLGEKTGMVFIFGALAFLAREEGHLERSARLFGSEQMLRDATDFPVAANDVEEHNAYVASVRDRLGEEAFAAAWAQGYALTLEQAIAYALSPQK